MGRGRGRGRGWRGWMCGGGGDPEVDEFWEARLAKRRSEVKVWGGCLKNQ